MLRRPCWHLIALVAFSLSARLAFSEEDFSRGMLDRPAAIEAAKAVTSEKYPDADDVLIGGMQRLRYEADGTYTQWAEEYIKILTEQGRRRYLTVSSSFTIPYQRGPEDCRIPLLEILKPDGRAVPVDVQGQSRIMIDSGSMSKNIYNPNQKLIQVNVAGLELGDVLHVVMFDRIVHPRMKDTWCDWFGLEGPTPVVGSVIEVLAPTNRPLRSIALKDEIKGTVTHSVTPQSDGTLYRWEVRNVPRMFPEPNMPPVYTCVQRLLVSTAPDWQSVSRWYWQLCEPHFAASPAMKAKVETLTRGIEGRRQKIEALFTFVSQRIRYMGITAESEAPGYEPHDAKDTFDAEHGVCRDKAALLVAMLRLAGLEAFPTLIDTGAKKDLEVPQPYFDHAIAAVREPDGTYQLMDPTDETTTTLLPAYLDDKSYLVATPEGDPLRTSPVDPAEHNLMRIETRGRINADGRLEAETQMRFEGVNDNVYRGWFAQSKPEDRRRFLEGLMERTLPGARVTEAAFSPANMMDVSTTLTVRVAYEATDVFINDGRALMLPLPILGTRLGLVNYIIGRTGLKQRKYPLQTETACGVLEHITLDLDASVGTVESLPVRTPFEDAAITWASNLRQTGNTLEASLDFRLKAVEFSPAEYLNLKATLTTMEHALREMPIYGLPPGAQSAPGTADALVLDETVAYDVTDAHRWTETRSVRKKILTYAGKKQNSELKIGYNTGWEAVRLDRASVTMADGRTREISPREINLMDAPWVGSAARYPAGKILVASLPAVDTGSMIEYCYVRTCTNRPFFAVYESFRSLDPIAHKQLRIAAPAGLLRVGADGLDGCHMACTTNTLKQKVQYEWTVENVAPVKREDLLPPWWSFNPTVYASAGDWRGYARELNRALRKAAAHGRRAADKARRLTKSAGNDAAKLAAIRDFMAQQVRETEPGLAEMPLDQMATADRTLSDGYGNTTDRAVLFYAMLRAAGFAPEFVLASALPAIETLGDRLRGSPVAGAFNEVLVRVRERGAGGHTAERWIYLNDTDQYAALGATSHEGAFGLFLPAGSLAEIVPAKPDVSESRYWITVETNGDASLKKRQLLYGTGFGAEHKRFAEMTPEERRRSYQEMIALLSQGAETNSDLVTDFSGYPGVIEFTVRLPRYAVADRGFLYFTFPEFLQNVLNLQTDTRVNPLLLPTRGEKRVRMEIAVPSEYQVEYLPPDTFRRNAAGAGIDVRTHAAMEAGKEDRKVIAEAEARMKPAVVPPFRYQELLDLDETLSRKHGRMILLRAPLPAPAVTNAPAGP